MGVGGVGYVGYFYKKLFVNTHAVFTSNLKKNFFF